MTPLLLLLLTAHGHHRPSRPPAAPASNPAIETTVASHQAEVQRCYAYATSGGKSLIGKIVLGWFVTPGGEAAQMRVEDSSTLHDEALVQCIEDKLSSWSFPTTEKGQQVTHGWEFGSKSASPAPAATSHPKRKKRSHKR